MFTGLYPFVAGVVASMVIGYLWYSQMLFGKQWMKLMGMKKNNMKMTSANMTPLLVTQFLLLFLMSYILGNLLRVLGVTSPVYALQMSFLVWLGFVATTTLTNTMYEGKPIKLFILNNGYHLVSLMVMGFLYVLLAR